ncbi:unnamed protein product [Protopolystoma xenopodis]|uniref:Uncharacterized protein n=1 Tax=Protopolystoma xenopodis TaxID=117903 RepID=A0A3S5ABN2_9PLAT|nr:unnamed protein product [Protopolystoma xenopodis]
MPNILLTTSVDGICRLWLEATPEFRPSGTNSDVADLLPFINTTVLPSPDLPTLSSEATPPLKHRQQPGHSVATAGTATAISSNRQLQSPSSSEFSVPFRTEPVSPSRSAMPTWRASFSLSSENTESTVNNSDTTDSFVSILVPWVMMVHPVLRQFLRLW